MDEDTFDEDLPATSKNPFIDDEAELSGEDEVSEDELSDEEPVLGLIDEHGDELEDDGEAVRNLFHKQLEQEDNRAVLLLKEQLEDKNVINQRRRKFRWRDKEIMDTMRRHYDPDDDDSQDDEEDDDDDDIDVSQIAPRLKQTIRPPTVAQQEVQSSITSFLLGDRQTVEALSTRAPIREDREKILKREMRRIKEDSIFDHF